MADHSKETIDLTMSDDEQGDSVLLNLDHDMNDMNTDTLRRHCADLRFQLTSTKQTTKSLDARLAYLIAASDIAGIQQLITSLDNNKTELDAAKEQIQYQTNRVSAKEKEADRALAGEKAYERMYDELARRFDNVQFDWEDGEKLRAADPALYELIQACQRMDLGGQDDQIRGGRLFHVTLKVEPRT